MIVGKITISLPVNAFVTLSNNFIFVTNYGSAFRLHYANTYSNFLSVLGPFLDFKVGILIKIILWQLF